MEEATVVILVNVAILSKIRLSSLLDDSSGAVWRHVGFFWRWMGFFPTEKLQKLKIETSILGELSL